LYGLVARGTTVLAEHSTVVGNAHLVAHRILEKLPEGDSRTSYSQDRHIFHVLVSGGLTYLCMAEEEVGRRIPYTFLEDIKDRFVRSHGEAAGTAAAYGLDEQFGHVIEDRMRFFATDRSADAINRVRGELGEVRNIMIENIDKVLDRGERIELLVDKTDHLSSEAFTFTRDSRRLKRKMWWKNTRLMVVVFVMLLLIAYVIVCFACSPTFRC